MRFRKINAKSNSSTIPDCTEKSRKTAKTKKNAANFMNRKTQNNDETSAISSLFTDISFAKYIPKPSSAKTINRAVLAISAT
jgi:hypothetical protein